MTRQNIIDGPGKWDLMVSLFEGNPTPRHKVEFKHGFVFTRGGVDADGTATVAVAITGIEQEDGSGESWIFRGFAPDGVRVHGYYSSKIRKGYFDW